MSIWYGTEKDSFCWLEVLSIFLYKGVVGYCMTYRSGKLFFFLCWWCIGTWEGEKEDQLTLWAANFVFFLKDWQEFIKIFKRYIYIIYQGWLWLNGDITKQGIKGGVGGVIIYIRLTVGIWRKEKKRVYIKENENRKFFFFGLWYIFFLTIRVYIEREGERRLKGGIRKKGERGREAIYKNEEENQEEWKSLNKNKKKARERFINI